MTCSSVYGLTIPKFGTDNSFLMTKMAYPSSELITIIRRYAGERLLGVIVLVGCCQPVERRAIISC